MLLINYYTFFFIYIYLEHVVNITIYIKPTTFVIYLGIDTQRNVLVCRINKSVNIIIHYEWATFYSCFTISKHISLHNCTHILSSQNMTIIKSIKSLTENDTHKSVRGNFDPPWIPFLLKCYKGKILECRISLTNSSNIKYQLLTQEVDTT